ncbi:hypothetical protein Efla_004528 [Eimeria flavescens]
MTPLAGQDVRSAAVNWGEGQHTFEEDQWGAADPQLRLHGQAHEEKWAKLTRKALVGVLIAVLVGALSAATTVALTNPEETPELPELEPPAVPPEVFYLEGESTPPVEPPSLASPPQAPGAVGGEEQPEEERFEEQFPESEQPADGLVDYTAGERPAGEKSATEEVASSELASTQAEEVQADLEKVETESPEEEGIVKPPEASVEEQAEKKEERKPSGQPEAEEGGKAAPGEGKVEGKPEKVEGEPETVEGKREKVEGEPEKEPDKDQPIPPQPAASPPEAKPKQVLRQLADLLPELRFAPPLKADYPNYYEDYVKVSRDVVLEVQGHPVLREQLLDFRPGAMLDVSVLHIYSDMVAKHVEERAKAGLQPNNLVLSPVLFSNRLKPFLKEKKLPVLPEDVLARCQSAEKVLFILPVPLWNPVTKALYDHDAHFFVVVIDRGQRSLHIVDTLPQPKPYYHPLLRFVKAIAEQMGDLEGHADAKYHAARPTPEPVHYNACGVFAAENLLCLAENRRPHYTPFDSPSIRRRMLQFTHVTLNSVMAVRELCSLLSSCSALQIACSPMGLPGQLSKNEMVVLVFTESVT